MGAVPGHGPLLQPWAGARKLQLPTPAQQRGRGLRVEESVAHPWLGCDRRGLGVQSHGHGERRVPRGENTMQVRKKWLRLAAPGQSPCSAYPCTHLGDSTGHREHV